MKWRLGARHVELSFTKNVISWVKPAARLNLILMSYYCNPAHRHKASRSGGM